MAITSLVLGILSLTCFWLLSAIPAVVCGHVAYSRIRRSAGALTGEGLALGGMITGYISIAFSIVILPLLLAIAIPNFVKARDMAQTNVCIENLRRIEGAKEMWALENKKTTTDIPTGHDLEKYMKVSFAGLKCPAGGVYSVKAVGDQPTCSIAHHELPGR